MKSSQTPSIDLSSLLRLQTLDISDRLQVMISQENEPCYASRDYLRLANRSDRSSSHRSQSKRLTPEARTKIVKWMYDIVDYFELQRETVSLAMSYVDRFMSSSSSSRNVNSFQLLSLTCLFIATKSFDTIHIDASLLSRASRGCYSVDEILAMEDEVLVALGWRLSDPTALGFANHAIALLGKVVVCGSSRSKTSSRISSVVDFTRLQIELATCDYRTSVLHKPSTIALASVMNSMGLLDFTTAERKVFARAVQDVTGLEVRSTVVRQCRLELNEVFDRQSEDVLSRGSIAENSANLNKSCSQVVAMVPSFGNASVCNSRGTEATPQVEKVSFSDGPSPTCVDELRLRGLQGVGTIVEC
ncbi:cyclin, cyclin d, cell cycle control [Thalassiosira pseudonana CCMP1335]|uniref:Cyclin, cyclin d, cell cycle control n=1 Tax=Thalassiosira pseudonana TaxID=35128 RepID=B8CDE5_THAPS|nr:cyclin, cyclin d, cell cycle control [Thalassiosira pseudonana CCMP1335]EED88585.1 cyclin, cyclin d, cell cycle control [Thalassiosira pseudonana CCMP1335]